jgi:uroporphyrinogen-III synthase
MQAARTVSALREAGAEVIEFPVLDIAPIDASIPEHELVTASGIIFVSANAVAYGLPVLARAGQISAGTAIFSIGRATAAALLRAGFNNVVSPQQSIDSEGLLLLPELQSVEGRHIILVKGVSELGGRTLLEQTLSARGARVTILECYLRAPVVPDLASRETLKNSLASNGVHVFFALSVETLDSLANIFLTMNISLRSKIVVLVPHPRVADAAQKCGFDKIAQVPMADAAMIAALIELKPQLLSERIL